MRGFYLDAEGNDVTHMFVFVGNTYGSDFLTTDKPHHVGDEFKSNQQGAAFLLEPEHKRAIQRSSSFATRKC